MSMDAFKCHWGHGICDRCEPGCLSDLYAEIVHGRFQLTPVSHNDNTLNMYLSTFECAAY